MKKSNKLKVFNDPIYGFITIPNEQIFALINHRYFQRLRRISQMGLSYLVYPGAHHTRFHHALGSMHLMTKAIQVLRYKGVAISEDEEKGLLAAILLHDIGHGPFSHAMENSIVNGVHHEQISLFFMERLNREFNGSLTLAIQIFNGTYPRKFMHQLVSGQLDMDRLDYLKRDSFFSGVFEGNINAERLIAMLHVVDDHLVVEEKGIYSVEKFLVGRRLMYWQVYLHKTSLVAEQLLIRVLKRAKELSEKREMLHTDNPLHFFLKHRITRDNFTEDILERFSTLDDVDVMAAMKTWQYDEDFILSRLCTMILNRDLLKVKVKKKPVGKKRLNRLKEEVRTQFNISDNEVDYFVFSGSVSNQAYRTDKQNIRILTPKGSVVDVAKASDQFHIKALSKPVVKYFLCYPKT